MLGTLERATHKEWGPVLVVAFFNATPEPKAVVYVRDGRIKACPISQLSAAWHYDPNKMDFVSDFETAEEGEET